MLPAAMALEYKTYLAANILSEERVVRFRSYMCNGSNVIVDYLSTAQ